MTHIKNIRKQTDNKFLNLYELDFTDRQGTDRNYYFVTRNDDDHIKGRTHALDPEGIVIYAVTKEEHPRLVVEKEYRFPGETPGQAAVREMREETGFHFTEYTGGEAFARRPFFLAPGFTDEPGSAVFGFADADGRRELESSEWIEVFLADREEVRRILREEKVSLRCAFLMMHFLQQPDEEPFRFLDCRF